MHQRIALFLVLGLFGVSTAWQATAQGTPPAIVFHPTNRVSSIGGSATFIVTASGSNLVYRWRKEGIPLANGTNRLLSLINLSNGTAGAYTVVVTNFFGSVTSQPAFLTLTGAPPRIYVQPTNTLVCPGGPDTILRVQVSGSPPFNYQWLRGGTLVPGQDSNTLSLPGDPAHVGDYWVIVANGYGAETSQVARLSLGPIITQQPVSQIAQAGSNVLFQVGVVACTSTRYQWRFNGANIPGGTNAGLYYRSPDIEHEGNYDVVVSDNFRSLTSAVAHLTVLRYPPQIFNQPIDFIETFSTNILFAVTYGGAPWPSFQWYHDGVAIPGENDRLLRFMAYPWLQGDYWVVLSNSMGSVTSRVASFTLPQIPPRLLTPPASLSYCPELAYEHPPFLFVDAVSLGAVPTYYQWFREGVAVPGATNATLFIADIPEPFGRYTVEVSNFAGTTTAGTAIVSYAVSIEVDPAFEQTVIAGSSAAFTAQVTACGPYTLQWRKDGADLPGQTNSALYIDPVTLEDAGSYTLVATYQSTSNSRNLQLHVEPFDPVIYDGEPFDQTVNAGEYVFLNFQYETGFPPANIQWHFNGRPIPGETNDTLQFLALSPAQQGRYSVTLSNVSTVVTSRLARVQIFFSPPLFDIEPEDVTFRIDGTSIGFYSYALGAPPPSMQWYFNGQRLPGATNDFLAVPFLSTNQAGGYSVVASNFLGSVTSRVATLTAELYPPTFFVHPVSQSFRSGDYVFLVASATGSPLPQFQWFHNGVSIPGENLSQLGFQAGFRSQEGTYYAVASNYLGAATSLVAQVTIQILPPSILTHPLPQQKVVGESFYLSVQLSNNIPALVQWQRDGVDLAGETNTYIIVRSARTNDAGEYRAIAWNDAGTATSRVARVDVRLPESLDRWSWRRSLPQGNTLSSTAYDLGQHLAVGRSGAVIVSTNGIDWQDRHTTGQRHYRSSLAFGNGVFVAIDVSFNQPQYSTNGVDWYDAALPAGTYSSRVVFGNGRFIASSYANTVLHSTNGIDWEQSFVELEPAEYLNGLVEGFSFYEIHFANNRFIANYQPEWVGGVGVAVSSDGLNWQRADIDRFASAGGIFDITYGNGRYAGIVGGVPWQILLSSDGQVWTPTATANSILAYPLSIAYGNGRFVAVGYGIANFSSASIAHSTDGLTWTPVPEIATNGAQQVRFQNDRFVVVGQYGALATSTNGLDWTEHNRGSGGNIRGITSGGGSLVAVGNDGFITTSTNGRDWARHDLATPLNLRSIACFKGRFVAVGEQAETSTSRRITIYTSADAVHWQPATSLVGEAEYGDFYSLAHNGNVIVAVGNSAQVAVSQDGLDWMDALPLPTSRDLNAVIWTGDRFAAAGKDGTVVFSTDGRSWTSHGPGGSRNLHGIAYGNGVFVTVGNSGRRYVGNGNGVWQQGDWPGTGDLSDIVFAGGRFLTIGDNGIVHTSTDGTNWTRRANPSENDLRSAFYSEGSFWIVGNNETILQSAQIDPALRIRRVAGSSLLLDLELLGETGLNHRLQGSHNFTNWTDILNFTAGPEPYQHRTGDPAAAGRRFYRVVRP